MRSLLVLALAFLFICGPARAQPQPQSKPTIAPVPGRATAQNRPADSAQALVGAGYEEMRLRRIRPALALFDRAIALSPQWALAHADRAIALVHLDRLDEAETSAATALRLDPTEFAAHQAQGFLALRRGHPEEAVRATGRALEFRPANSFTLGIRAEAHLQLGQFAEALADYDTVLGAEPANAAAMSGRARILIQQGHDAEALAAMDRAIAADPGNFNLLRYRGDLLVRLGRADEARAAYQAALAMFDRMRPVGPVPTEISTAGGPRLMLLALTGRQKEAIAALDAGLHRYPGTVIMLASRCRVRVLANVELDLAQHDCDEALRDEPGHPVALPARALLGLRTHEWAASIRDYSGVLETAPRDAGALFGRGLARLRSGDTAGGRADLAAARRLQFDVEWDYSRTWHRAATGSGRAGSATRSGDHRAPRAGPALRASRPSPQGGEGWVRGL